MNIFKKIGRLAFISGHPVIRLLGWAAVTAIDVGSRTPPALPLIQPIARFELFGIANNLINGFLSSKDNQTTMINWCLNAAFGLTKSIFNSIFNRSNDRIISATDVPNIMAGNIQGTALVPGLNSNIFVIALSPNMINFIGFLFICVRSFIIGTLLYHLLGFVFRKGQEYFSRPDKEDYIDVPGRPLSSNRSQYLTKIKSRYY